MITLADLFILIRVRLYLIRDHYFYYLDLEVLREEILLFLTRLFRLTFVA